MTKNTNETVKLKLSDTDLSFSDRSVLAKENILIFVIIEL